MRRVATCLLGTGTLLALVGCGRANVAHVVSPPNEIVTNVSRQPTPPSVPSLRQEGTILPKPFHPLTRLPQALIRFAGSEDLAGLHFTFASTLQEGGQAFTVRLVQPERSPTTVLYGWGHAILTPQPGSSRLSVQNGFSQTAPFAGLPQEMDRILGTALRYGPPQSVGGRVIAGQKTRGYRWTAPASPGRPVISLTVYLDPSGQVLGLTGRFAPALYGAAPPETYRMFATSYRQAAFRLPRTLTAPDSRLASASLTSRQAAALLGAAYRPLHLPTGWLLTGIAAAKHGVDWQYLTPDGPLSITEEKATTPLPLVYGWLTAVSPHGRYLSWLSGGGGGAGGTAFVAGRTLISLLGMRTAYLGLAMNDGSSLVGSFGPLHQPTLFTGTGSSYRFSLSPNTLFTPSAGAFSGVWAVPVTGGLVFALPPTGSLSTQGGPLPSGGQPVEYVSSPHPGETVTARVYQVGTIPAGPTISLLNLYQSGPRQVTWLVAQIGPNYRRIHGTMTIP